MGGLRVLILGCCVVASGCGVFCLQRIWYDLTASVVGVVGKSDIREVVGEDFIPESSSYFWNTLANDREQLLRVRLSTRKDLVSFANRKSTTISAQWHFCDDQEQAANLGYVSVFVDAKEVPKIPVDLPRWLPTAKADLRTMPSCTFAMPGRRGKDIFRSVCPIERCDTTWSATPGTCAFGYF